MVDRSTKNLYAVKKESSFDWIISLSFIDNLNKTPSSMDTQLESDNSTSTPSSSNYLQLPPTNTTNEYPRRDAASSHSRSTLSSLAKSKVCYYLFINLLRNLMIFYSEHQSRHFERIANSVTTNKNLWIWTFFFFFVLSCEEK